MIALSVEVEGEQIIVKIRVDWEAGIAVLHIHGHFPCRWIEQLALRRPLLSVLRSEANKGEE